MYFETKEKEDCCGCKVCASVCPVQAITFIFDEEGFWYPKINQTTCIHCNKCSDICSLNVEKLPPIQEENQTYAGFSLDSSVLNKSTSGGIFTHISDYFLESGGHVFGHRYSVELQPVCTCADTKKERDSFCGSKYVQSDMGAVYGIIKEKVQTGMPVLVTGTPCQINAVKNYFGNMVPDNLFTMDLVCHGVPSPTLFAEYIALFERNAGKKISNVVFRSKNKGWMMPLRIFEYTDGSHDEIALETDSFNILFLGLDCILRPSCYKCRYAGTQRTSDITIADFWGIQLKHPEMFNDNRGVSLILANTQKGRTLLEIAGKNMNTKQVPLADALQKNTPLRYRMTPYFDRDRFFIDYRKRGLVFCLRKYTSKDFFYRIYRKLRKMFFSKTGFFNVRHD